MQDSFFTLIRVKDMPAGALNYATSMVLRGDRGDKWIYVWSGLWEPADDWAQGGPLIEEYKLKIYPFEQYWWADREDLPTSVKGDTILIAAMRAVLILNGVSEMEVPSWLLK